MTKNIVVFSDGTGQDGGVRPEQRVSNIYKMYRASRVSFDNPTDPAIQVTMYDPGLGTDLSATALIDRLATVARQGKHHFARRCGRDGAAREFAPLGVREQHDVDRLAPYHARSRIVGEIRIVLKTEGLVEGHRRVEVGDRQVHENHLGHWGSFFQLERPSRPKCINA